MMTISEFWRCIEQVYGSCYGRCLVGDLYLPLLRGTAEQALKDGADPELVWQQLVRETQMDEAARWVHRQPLRES